MGEGGRFSKLISFFKWSGTLALALALAHSVFVFSNFRVDNVALYLLRGLHGLCCCWRWRLVHRHAHTHASTPFTISGVKVSRARGFVGKRDSDMSKGVNLLHIFSRFFFLLWSFLLSSAVLLFI